MSMRAHLIPKRRYQALCLKFSTEKKFEFFRDILHLLCGMGIWPKDLHFTTGTGENWRNTIKLEVFKRREAK